MPSRRRLTPLRIPGRARTARRRSRLSRYKSRRRTACTVHYQAARYYSGAREYRRMQSEVRSGLQECSHHHARRLSTAKSARNLTLAPLVAAQRGWGGAARAGRWLKTCDGPRTGSAGTKLGGSVCVPRLAALARRRRDPRTPSRVRRRMDAPWSALFTRMRCPFAYTARHLHPPSQALQARLAARSRDPRAHIGALWAHRALRGCESAVFGRSPPSPPLRARLVRQ